MAWHISSRYRRVNPVGLPEYVERMRGDESRVGDAFCRWLETEGWQVQREVDWVDVAAERGGQRLYAEVKARTTSPGLDVDTAYGQLLRRMKEDSEGAVFALSLIHISEPTRPY